MAYPEIIIDSAASGAADANSGTGALKASVPVCLATVNIPKIGLYEIQESAKVPFSGSLSSVATDGSETIQLNETTAGKTANLRITAVKTSTSSGNLTNVGGTAQWSCADSTVFSQYDQILIDGVKTYVVSVDDATQITTTITGAGDEVRAYVNGPQLTVENVSALNTYTESSYVSGKIGGPKASFWGTLTSKLWGNSTIFDARPGSTISILTDETIVNNSSSANWRMTSTAAAPILIKGRSGRTVITTSGSYAPFITAAAVNGIALVDLDFVCNHTASKYVFATDAAHSFVCTNVRLLEGVTKWSGLATRHGGRYDNCWIDLNGALGLSHATYNHCIVRLNGSAFNGDNASYITSFYNSVLIGPSGRATLTLRSYGSVVNCDLYNVVINVSASGLRAVSNNSFSFASSYSGYAVTYTSTAIFVSDWSIGGGGCSNNYYNCTGLISPATYAGADLVWRGTTNINPGYTDIANGNATNTALLGQGIGSTNIGSYAPTSTGGGGTLGCACPNGVIMLLKNQTNWVAYETVNISTGLRVTDAITNHTIRVGKNGTEATATNNGNATYHKVGTTVGLCFIQLTAAECNNATTVSVSGETTTSGVRINIINAGLVPIPNVDAGTTGGLPVEGSTTLATAAGRITGNVALDSTVAKETTANSAATSGTDLVSKLTSARAGYIDNIQYYTQTLATNLGTTNSRITGNVALESSLTTASGYASTAATQATTAATQSTNAASDAATVKGYFSSGKVSVYAIDAGVITSIQSGLATAANVTTAINTIMAALPTSGRAASAAELTASQGVITSAIAAITVDLTDEQITALADGIAAELSGVTAPTLEQIKEMLLGITTSEVAATAATKLFKFLYSRLLPKVD